MHGTIMLFLFIIPTLSGFANYIVPLQLGAPDMAFPRINALSFWLLPLGGLLIFSGYLFGGAAAEGWTGVLAADGERALAGRRHRPVDHRPDAGRHRLDPRRGELHHDDLQDAGAGHDAVPDADLRLDRARDRRPDPARHAGPDGRADRAVHRSQLRRVVLRSDRRRQPDPVAAHLLVLRPPGGLHRHPAGDGRRQRGAAGLQPQAAVRLQGVRVRHDRASAC